MRTIQSNSPAAASGQIEPSRECPLCPRLVEFRLAQRANHPDWHNAPVPTFGSCGRILIVGLAPGLQGANRTGRPFTGDWAGDLLYETLADFRLSAGVYDERPDDGLILRDTKITNAVRCVPPANKPTGAEIATCNGFLAATIHNEPELRIIVALGRISHDSILRAVGWRQKDAPFGHGRDHAVTDRSGRAIHLFDSYHCSRYNTNTGVLTTEMFKAVFKRVRAALDSCLQVAAGS